LTSDDSICTNSIILIHKNDTQEVIIKRIFQNLIGCLNFP